MNFVPPLLLDVPQHRKSQNRIFFAFSPVFSPTSFRAIFWKKTRMKIDTESCPSGRRCSTRNAVSRKASRVRIPNSPPRKACNHADYRLFYFCPTGKACTIFGFQGRKSEVLPGTDRPPAAAEVAALRQSKASLHCLRRGDFRLVIQVGVDVRRGGEVTVSQPLLNVLEGNAVGQQ